MTLQSAKHTLDIFKRMYDRLPPLVPEEIKKEMEHALEHLEDDASLGLQEMEDMQVAFGKKIWAYWKAFEEFVNIEEGKIGEKFLLGKLDLDIRKKYKEFKEHGGTYRDLYSGDPATFFNTEERGKLCVALVDVDQEVRDYVRQTVLSTDRKKYEERVVEFQTILDDIEKRLHNLLIMAEDEEEHPQVAEEIRDKVRAFEHGLCLLGPHTQYEAVCGAEEHFIGRRQDLL